MGHLLPANLLSSRLVGSRCSFRSSIVCGCVLSANEAVLCDECRLEAVTEHLFNQVLAEAGEEVS